MNAIGSCALAPKSMLESTCDTAAHPATPTSPPIKTGRMDWLNTRFMIARLSAPGAIHMPVSGGHRLTLLDTAPYTAIDRRVHRQPPHARERPAHTRDGLP